MRRGVQGAARTGLPAWWELAGLALCLCVLAAPATASQTSNAATAQGLSLYYQGRYEAALVPFRQAVAADPQDAAASYYLGITYGRLGRYAEAADALESSIEIEPDRSGAALELGYALLQAERYGKAISWLREAAKEPPSAAKASFYIGMAEMRRGDSEAALSAFEAAATADPRLAVQAHYYEGVMEYRAGRHESASEHFRFVIDQGAQTEMATEAADFLEDIAAGTPRNYGLYGSVAFEYDSNVPLLSSNGAIRDQQEQSLGLSDKGDGLTTLTAGGWYAPLSSERMQLAVGYEIFQSLHYDLTDFNIQNHRVRAGFASDAGRFSYGLAARYDYYMRDTDSFLNEANASPWIRVPCGRLGDTDLYYRMRYRGYSRSAVSDQLDGFNHAVGIRQTIPLGPGYRFASIGYRFDHESSDETVDNAFAYDGHQAEAALGWQLPLAVTADLSYTFTHDDYDSAGLGREDDQHQVYLTLRRPINRTFAVSTGYLGEFNDSNQNAFQYNRHVGTVALEAKY